MVGAAAAQVRLRDEYTQPSAELLVHASNSRPTPPDRRLGRAGHVSHSVVGKLMSTSRRHGRGRFRCR